MRHSASPTSLRDKLLQGKVLIRNWHALNWETAERIAGRRSVDKRGAKSDEAYVRDVLGDMANARNILVINDEAHHAWRVPAESKVKGVAKEKIEAATMWIGGLDRIDRTRHIPTCYDSLRLCHRDERIPLPRQTGSTDRYTVLPVRLSLPWICMIVPPSPAIAVCDA